MHSAIADWLVLEVKMVFWVLWSLVHSQPQAETFMYDLEHVSGFQTISVSLRYK